MNLIHNNPYRIAGILAYATERELQKVKSKITAFARVGREIESEYDFDILNKITRTENDIEKAFASFQQGPDKVNHALFWFVDDIGIQHLKAGNEEKAVEEPTQPIPFLSPHNLEAVLQEFDVLNYSSKLLLVVFRFLH